MKILFVGVLDVEWSTNCSMKHELENIGHKVISFNYRTIAKEYAAKKSDTVINRLIDKGTSFLRSSRIPFNFDWYFLKKGRKEMNILLLDKIKKEKYDMILLSKTDSVDYNLLTEINKYSPTWYFFMDPMDQAVRINAAKYAKNSTWASATFSDVHEHFEKNGANSYWITQGVDTEVFKPEKTEKIYDVVFAGTKDYRRRRYVESLRKVGVSVNCFGEGWGNKSVYQEQLVDIYRESRIVLNFCREGRGFSIRVFQIMGSGAFVLSEYCLDLETIFKKGVHLDWFKDEMEMVEKVKYYLQKDEEREKIAQNGCRLVHGNYSWNKIMKDITDIVEGNIK
jgi:hypothetical protein